MKKRKLGVLNTKREKKEKSEMRIKATADN